MQEPRFLGSLTAASPQESTLAGAELPDTAQGVEAAIKQHRDFLTTMELHQQKTALALQAGESLVRQGSLYRPRVEEHMGALRAK